MRAERDRAPVAYVPLGALEWHGWHLPTGLDALKARALHLRVADETGGIVLPPRYYAMAGDDSEDESIGAALDEETLRPLLFEAFSRLCEAGYEVVVALTGHYPDAQMAMVEEVAESVESEYDASLIALPEHEGYEPEVRRGHAGKWETSFMLYLYPELVDSEEIDGHPQEPFRGVQELPDPLEASAEIGREMTTVIVETLTGRVEEVLEEQ